VVDHDLRDLAILLAIALLFVLTLHVLSTRVARQRELEARLDEAHTEIASLRGRLADATRPPVQFARMHMRESAVDRFARLRLATPRQSRRVAADRIRDRMH
jgi:hypothetical protein